MFLWQQCCGSITRPISRGMEKQWFKNVLCGFCSLLWFLWFLSRVSTLTRDIDIAILSVRLSIRLSVTRWYCMKTACRHSFFHRTVAQSF